MNILRKPDSLSYEGWEEWEKKVKKESPILYFIFEVIPDCFSSIRRYFLDIKYYILYRTTKKYHVVKTDLEPGYHDLDTRLIHSAFSLLVNFVEKEKGLERIDWSWTDEHRRVEKEIIDLYTWWKCSRSCREEIFDSYHRPEKEPSFRQMMLFNLDNEETREYYNYLDKLVNQEEKWFKEDTENLKRLIDIRSHLWV